MLWSVTSTHASVDEVFLLEERQMLASMLVRRGGCGGGRTSKAVVEAMPAMAANAPRRVGESER